MTDKPRTIDYDKGLKARALWALASEHYKMAQELETALHAVLQLEDDPPYCGHFTDEMWEGTFDTALRKSKIKIDPPKKSKQRR